MAARTWVLATILATSLALAGCTNSSSDKPDPGSPVPQPATPAPGDTASGDTPRGDAPPGASGGSSTVTPRPEDMEFSDGGQIQGSFAESWDIELASPIYRTARIVFTLDGLEPGSPPTARVNLAMEDLQGTPLRRATLGVGGEGNVADWTFAPGELPMKGTYRLVASAGAEGPLPSMGLGTYGVHITIDY